MRLAAARFMKIKSPQSIINQSVLAPLSAEPVAPARQRLPLAGPEPAAAAAVGGSAAQRPPRPARHHLRPRAHRRPHRGHRHPRRQDQDALEGDQVRRRGEGRRRRRPSGERRPSHILVGSEGAAQASHEDYNVSAQCIFDWRLYKIPPSLSPLRQGATRRADWG